MGKRSPGLMLACLVLLAGATPARASLKLELIASDGTYTNTVIQDTQANGGMVSYNTTINSNPNAPPTGTRFSVQSLSGSSNSPDALDTFGDPTNVAQLLISTLKIQSNHAGTLTILLTDNNFAAPAPQPGTFLKSVVSTNANLAPANASFTFQSYGDAGNSNDFSTVGTTPGVQGPFSGTVTNNTASTAFSYGPGPFSLLSIAKITFTGAGSIGITAETDVIAPEPATLVMALAGLPVAGLFWARRRRAGVRDAA